MLEAATTGVTTVIGWVGSLVEALVSTDGQLSALLPLLAVGVGVSGVMLGIKVVRSTIWGA